MRRWMLLVYLLVGSALVAAAPTTTGVQDNHVEPAFGGLDSPIRPGSSLGGYCTYNWVFYDLVYPTAEDPHPTPAVYIGTAAHCTDDLGERTVLPGVGHIGTVVYDSDLVGSDVDFSLVEIDAPLVEETNPQMRGFVGPTRVVAADDLEVGDQVDVHGYGIVLGQNDLTRSRFGFLVNWTDHEYVADMPAVNGDSGAPLLHDETGAALGIISRYGFSAMPPSTDVGPLMTWVMDELEEAGFDVTIATVER